MAAAEVRAAWQRTANRCFVQEDAKRTPKLACCQSSCATSKLVDAGLASAANESSHATGDVTKKTSMEGMQEAYSKNSQAFPELMDMMAKHETKEIDSVGSLVSKQTKDFSLDSDYSWIECEKALPWWQTSDRDELACLVSQKSLNHFENCDLPPPQKKFLGGKPSTNISDDKIKTAFQAKRSLDLSLMHRKQGPSINKGLLDLASDKPSSYTTIHEGVTEQVFEGDHSKAQLIEALRHSQTRAREAEEKAKQADSEKEHLIALFFIQASQLIAYKQWFRLLQLETLCTQIKSKDQPISTLFPEALPWMSFEYRKRKQKIVNAKQEMLGKPNNDIPTTYAVAFALGLSLVGAGLLLGWTAGWMLPRL